MFELINLWSPPSKTVKQKWAWQEFTKKNRYWLFITLLNTKGLKDPEPGYELYEGVQDFSCVCISHKYRQIKKDLVATKVTNHLRNQFTSWLGISLSISGPGGDTEAMELLRLSMLVLDFTSAKVTVFRDSEPPPPPWPRNSGSRKRFSWGIL